MRVGIYGYCIVPPDHLPGPALTGVDAAAVSAHACAGLAIWVSEADRSEATVANIEAHNRVVEAAITDSMTPVPLRFGQWANQMDVFEAAIWDRAGWYQQRLAAFAGALEYGLRVVSPHKVRSARDVHAAAPASGRDYMNYLRDRAAVAKEQQVDEARIRAAITRDLGDLVREERTTEPQTPHAIVTVSHLVARANFDAYRLRAEGLRLQLPGLRFLLSGPWAPYSFADER